MTKHGGIYKVEVALKKGSKFDSLDQTICYVLADSIMDIALVDHKDVDCEVVSIEKISDIFDDFRRKEK